MKKSFLLYCDQIDIFNALDDEQAGVLIKSIFTYSTSNISPFFNDPVVSMAFISIKNTLERDQKKYKKICDRNKNNGLKGGRPKNPKNPVGSLGTQENPKKPKKPDSDSDSGSGSVSLNDTKEKDILHSKKNAGQKPSKKEPFYLTKKKRKLVGKRLEAFERFWVVFNYKKGKAEAADSWLDIPELTNNLVEDICKSAQSENINRKDLIENGQTPKMAQGWLTSRRWEDEHSTAADSKEDSEHLKRLKRYTNLDEGDNSFSIYCEENNLDEKEWRDRVG